MSNRTELENKNYFKNCIYTIDCENPASTESYDGKFYFVDTKTYGKTN